MKNKFLLIILALSINSFAQTQKNNWVVGASSVLGFNSSQYNYKNTYGNGQDFENKFRQFDINVMGGYFVINNLAVGLDLSYRNSVNTWDVFRFDPAGNSISIEQKSKGNSISLMPLVSYYFANDSKFYPYLSAGAGFNTSKYKYYTDDDYDSNNKNDAFIWKVKGGVSYFITPSIALDFGLSYDQVKYDNDEYTQNSVNTFGANVGLKLFL
ncbi:outer membrane beta-barrel protein [Empedobacter falsenii]|uniref:outer membrane protein n=1 Tax=Empedobacter falsenii TaxID=343874 RepID=UPI002578EE06|nr:outer membrane beta-barrel protein [Empedobacter falsenii]MDM1296890.1 outer membrane beta-barrel protein [Empedobacter falsenii]MDM1316683.1 outer membrane beta-barrel protein [Empedobacter falsenii]